MCTISKLTGQFYGGAVDFSGTVDATKNALAVDLKGSLQGIYFGEMLRGTAGTNSFGNDNLTVAVDGKINVMDISVRGSGRTTEEESSASPTYCSCYANAMADSLSIKELKEMSAAGNQEAAMTALRPKLEAASRRCPTN